MPEVPPHGPRRTLPGIVAGTCEDRKSTRLNSSHSQISYAVFCLKKKKKLEATCGPSYVTTLCSSSTLGSTERVKQCRFHMTTPLCSHCSQRGCRVPRTSHTVICD